jgi:hypothetical protein
LRASRVFATTNFSLKVAIRIETRGVSPIEGLSSRDLG